MDLSYSKQYGHTALVTEDSNLEIHSRSKMRCSVKCLKKFTSNMVFSTRQRASLIPNVIFYVDPVSAFNVSRDFFALVF